MTTADNTPAISSKRRKPWTWLWQTLIRRDATKDLMPYPAPAEDDDAKALVIERWKKSFEAPDKARARAQAGVAIVGTLGAAFVGAAILTRFADQHSVAKCFAIATSILWIITMALYLDAATKAPSGGVNPSRTEATPWQERAKNAIRASQVERAELVWRLNRANLAAVAMIACAATALSVGFVAPGAEFRAAFVTFTQDGKAFFDTHCPGLSNEVSAMIDPRQLEKAFVSITQVEKCPSNDAYTIRREWISVIRVKGN